VGIYVWEQDTSTGRMTDGFCVDNICNSNAAQNIFIMRAAGWEVRGNHCYVGATYGGSAIDLRQCFSTRVTNNYIDDYGRAATSGQVYFGILARCTVSRGSVISNNTIQCSENTAANTYRHLCVDVQSSVTTARATVVGNTIVGNSQSNGTGIRIEAASGTGLSAQVSANQINACNTPFIGVSTGTLTGRFDLYGTGSPESVVAAPIGSTFTRADAPDAGSAMYLKASGTSTTGWVSIGAAGSGSPDLTSLTQRVALLETIGTFNVNTQVNVVGDNSTDCTTGIQALIDYFGVLGTPIRLKFPKGIYRHTGLNIPYSNIWLEGVSNRTCVLDYRGSGTNGGLYWHGQDRGDYTGRKSGGGVINLGLDYHGSNNGPAVKIRSMTAMMFTTPKFSAYRGVGGCINARDWADSHIFEPEADYCGGVGTDAALFDFTALPIGSSELNATNNVTFGLAGLDRTAQGGEWAVDRIRVWGGRIENCADRILHAVAGNGHFCAKLLFVGTKAENSQTGSNGLGGSLVSGTQFYLSQVLDFRAESMECTLQGLRSTNGGPVPTCFQFVNCYGVHLEGTFSFGSIGAVQAFTSLITTDGGRGFHYDLQLNNGDATGAAKPAQVFRFVNNPNTVYRDPSMWAYDAEGVYEIADSGTFTGSSDWNDTLALAQASTALVAAGLVSTTNDLATLIGDLGTAAYTEQGALDSVADSTARLGTTATAPWLRYQDDTDALWMLIGADYTNAAHWKQIAVVP
jgi:hypothetical protein